MTIEIDQEILEEACKNIIENILICLPNAFKGTVYLVGKPPDIVATRITSGIIDKEKDTISWGLPEKSDYNPPGKPWFQYRDEPWRPLEAMAWCVERQDSWTAEDPGNDARSVRLQVEGIWTDFHHMEPVLIRKEDVYLSEEPRLDYPENYEGETLWENSDFVVAAVIKIHFNPHTIRSGGPETKVIKRLSRALGTELLSYQLKQQSLEAIKHLAEDRINSCNILADILRNVIAKTGLVFSLIKLELGFLRDQWERVLLMGTELEGMKEKAINSLSRMILDLKGISARSQKDLYDVQSKFLNLHMPPKQGERWIRMRIEEKWEKVMSEIPVEEGMKSQVYDDISNLRESLYFGTDPELVAAFSDMSSPLKERWIDLIYRETGGNDLELLNDLILFLEDLHFHLPHKVKSRKSLVRLKALAEVVGQLEVKANVILREILNGNSAQ